MEGSPQPQMVGSWLRCYRCWSQELEVQVHYEGIHRIDPIQAGERAEVVDELQEAVVQCLDCMHGQPHLAFHNGRIEPVEDRWERMVAGTPWVASCTVTVETPTRSRPARAPRPRTRSPTPRSATMARASSSRTCGCRKHDDDQIVVHLLRVGLYARSSEEASGVLEDAARGQLTITLAGRGVPSPRRHRRPTAPEPRRPLRQRALDRAITAWEDRHSASRSQTAGHEDPGGRRRAARRPAGPPEGDGQPRDGGAAPPPSPPSRT